MPEGTTDVPASTMSGEWEQAVIPWESLLEHTEGIDMQLGDDQYEFEDDLIAGYVSDEGNPDWEVPDIDSIEMERAGPQAAQSGVIYPASNN